MTKANTVYVVQISDYEGARWREIDLQFPTKEDARMWINVRHPASALKIRIIERTERVIQ